MSYERKKLLKLSVMVITAVVLAGPVNASTHRARSPGGATGGSRLHPGTWANQRAPRHIRHARDYSRDIYQYSREANRIDPAVAKAESEELGHNIIKAQQALTSVRQEVGSDAATIAALKSIEKHLASAVEQHEMLHEECCKPSVGGSVSMNCCSAIILDLEKAQAEHDALLRSLEIKAKASE